MISKKMTEGLNQQINREIYSAYLYLSMAAYSKSANLNGFANWFNVQFQEELIHAMKIFDYVNQQNQRVILNAIDQPTKDFSSSVDLFEKTLEHEKKITKFIHGLVDLARQENDNATYAFLQWFVTEQVEEEAQANELLQKLNLIGKSGSGLLVIDSQLAQREFKPE